MNINKLQNLLQKRGEIAFRRLISQQHRGIRIHFTRELTRSEMHQELKKRLENSRRDFSRLQNQGVLISPYLEIGAEYGLRSSLIESKFKVRGIALDIAQSSLEQVRWFANQFKLNRIPLRVCSDAHSLPFPDDSFAFIFCYQTLHHFPNPLPVVQEIFRVLKPNGYFFFAEEPISQKFNLNLFRRPTKTTGLLKFLKIFPLLPFISKIGKTETDFGIFEGTISLKVWRQITQLFNPVAIQIEVFPFGYLTSTLTFKEWSWQQIILDMFGGGIQALLQKEADTNEGKFKKNHTIKFTCPDCHIVLTPKIQLQCNKCGRVFGKTHGILKLLPLDLHTSLYAKST